MVDIQPTECAGIILMMPNVSSYMTIPFEEKGRSHEGIDCYGLIFLIFREQFGIDLPSYTEDYTTTHDKASVSALMMRESMDWPEIPLARARPGDVMILRVQGQPWHCGLIVDPPHFVHAVRVVGTVRARWDSALWEKRIMGVHRHPQMREPACR